MKYPTLFFSLLIPAALCAQENDFPHPELDWFTVETEHFLIHYHSGTERTAREVARIAEEIYGPVTEMYRHTPDNKVSIVIRDHDDYSNGLAYFYDNKIEIWAPSLDFELRGTHPWLLNVVTHEFTHIVQIQTAMKLGRRVPGIYFQWLGYEAERRPDVLYGFPNVIVSYPLSAFVVPSWFAEGVAQFNHPDFQYDYWDTHRDMILRMYMLDGNPLSWEEMAVFGKTSLGNESSYNAGFSIVEFIAEKYGPDELKKISEALSSPFRLTIDGAIEAVLGKTGEELYNEWKNEKTQKYRKSAVSIQSDLREGRLIEEEGFGNFYPQFSQDGSKLAYVSNKQRDYFSPSSVYIYDLKTQQTKKVVSNVRSSLSFSPDGRYLFYSRATRENEHWSRFFDIYRYNLEREDETRLSHGWRAQNPKVSADGSKLVFACGGDGTLNIGVADSDGRNFRKLTQFADGEQVFTPTFSPDGKTIAFGYSTADKQSIAMVGSDGSNLKILAAQGDSRNPSFSKDGKFLYYSSDRTGIFNIYALNLESGLEQQVTNVLGGAFLPSEDGKKNLAYATYTSSGYKIGLMTLPGTEILSGQNATVMLGESSTTRRSPATEALQPVASNARRANLGPNNNPIIADSKPYKNVFTSLTLIPFVRFDNYNQLNAGIDMLKPGLYFVSNDMLDKLSLFGGAAINRSLERDLFLIFQFRDRVPVLYELGWEPTISIELYNLTRKTDNSIELPPHTSPIGIDVTYNLFEFDVILSQKIFHETTNLRLAYTLSRYSADIGSFANPNLGGLINPAFNNVYLIGTSFSGRLKHDDIQMTVDKEINPLGRSIFLNYSYEMNKFNPNGDFDIVNGILVPLYSIFDFQRVEASWTEHLALPFEQQTLSLGVRGGTILGPGVDEFFDFYGGGFAGIRGYPFYAIGGNELASAQLTYRFPVSTSLDFRFLQLYFKKLYASVFADIGNAWRGEVPSLSQWKKDAGFELRLEAFSFYAYPTRIFFSGAYGFDRFTRKFSGVDVTYGKEWRFYLGALFGFELSEISRKSF